MINKYDSPAQDRYFNTHVDLPFEQLMGTVAARQQQLNKEQDMLNKTYEDTQNLKYIPGSKDEQYIRDYISKSSDLVNKFYGSDLSDPIVKQQMRSQFSKMTDRQTIQNIQSSHAGWMENQKYKAKLKASGLYDEAIDEDPASGYDTVGSGQVYQHITSPFKNPRPAAEQYFNNLKPTDLGPKGDYFYKGVTTDKINEVADAKWNDFANTSEGSLYVKKIAREQGLDYTNDKVRKQIATEYLKGVGNEFTYEDRDGATLDAQVRAARGKKDTPSNPSVLTSQEQSIRTQADFDPYELGNMQFKDDGSVFVPDVRGSIPTSSGYGAVKGTIYANQSYRKEASEEEKVLSAKLEGLRTSFPALKGLSDKDTYQAYKDITNDGKAFPDLDKKDLPGVPSDAWAKILGTNYIDRKIQVQDEHGSSDLRSVTDEKQGSALKDLGYTSESFKHELQLAADGNRDSRISISGIAQNGPEAGMLMLEVADKSNKGGNKGKLRKVYITTSKEMKAIMTPTNEIYNNIRNFQSGITPVMYVQDPETGQPRMVAARVTPNIQKNPNTNKWDYNYNLEEGYLEDDGSFTPIGLTDINKIGQAQLKMLENSDYINSAMNFTKETNTSSSF